MSSKKILVVEDDADVRLGYKVLLQANDYETVFAVDGVSAISEALKSRPDLIVLDLGLPAGDGFVVLGRFSNQPTLAAIPVVVVSSRDSLGSKDRAIRAGAAAYIQKPWNDDVLLTVIHRVLHRPAELTRLLAHAHFAERT